MPILRRGSLCLALVAAVAISFASRPPAQADDHVVSRLAWRKNYTQACEESGRRKRPILVKITATWCGPCRQMQQLTFADERLRRRLRKDFVLLELDADENPDLISGFHVEAYPTTLVVSPELKVVSRMTGFKSAGDLISSLDLVKRSPLEVDESLADAESGESDDTQAASALAAVNTLKLGFDGFCLVSLLDENRLRQGDASYSTEHRGQTVCFFSDEHRQKFLANPERFWPVANGQCLVSTKDGRGAELGDPRVGVIWRGKLWFFSDRETQQRFLAMPQQYGGGL
jgi:YHS domain-containing protein/thioredoxin-related protein